MVTDIAAGCGWMSIEKLLNHLQRSLDRFGCKVPTMQPSDRLGPALGQRIVDLSIHRGGADRKQCDLMVSLDDSGCI